MSGTRLVWAVCIVVAVGGVGPAAGDVILPTDLSAQQATPGVVAFPAFQPAPMSTLNPVQLRQYLTFLNSVTDVDKDGFVDADKVHACNPTGYVVFHFRTRWGNERVTLGQNAASLLRVHLAERSMRQPRSEQKRPPAAPLSIPEPTGLLVWSAGMGMCLQRRFSPARRPGSS